MTRPFAGGIKRLVRIISCEEAANGGVPQPGCSAQALPEGLEIAEAPLPSAGRGEVRVRVLASSLNYTEVLIRRHLYPQTMHLRPPFVMGYDVVGEIDQLGDGVHIFRIGERV